MMQYRQLGTSDLRVSTISFGAWAIGGWMWGGTDDVEAERAIHCALDLGINCIDTAPSYGMGHSEEVVGQALRQRRRHTIVLATKCGVRWDHTEGLRRFETQDNNGKTVTLYQCLRPHSIREECDRSLRRLRTDYIDLYQIHWPDPTTPLEDAMDALLGLQRAGKIRYIGVSNLSVEQMDRCLERGAIVSVQPLFNALERDALKEVIPYAREHNLGVLAYSPLAQGLLTGKVSLDRVFPPGDGRREKPLFSVESRKKVQRLLGAAKRLMQERSLTPAQFFLAWTAAQPGVTTVLAGARNEAQVVENAGAGDASVPADALEELLREVGL